jgi:hypothetical protein
MMAERPIQVTSKINRTWKPKRVVKYLRYRIVREIGTQMVVMLSALRTGRSLLPRNIIFLLLILISVRG